MYIKENKNKEGKIISYRFITSYKDMLTNKNKNISKTWTIPFDLTTKKQIERELDNQKVLFLQYVKNLASGIYNEKAHKDMTITELSSMWLASILDRDKESQNHYQHSKKIMHFILDYFKDIKVCNINRIMINDFYTHLNNLTYTETKYIMKKSLAELKPKEMTHIEFFHKLNISEQTYKKTKIIGEGIGEQSYNNIYNYIKDEINNYIEVKTTTKLYALHSKKNIRMILVAMLSYAKKLGIIEQNYAGSQYFKNPFNGSTRKKTALNFNEFLNFANHIRKIDNIKHKTIITLLYTLGLRRCEAVGLKWSDIDFDKKTIFIQRDVIYTKEFGICIRRTKNKSSTRILPISEELFNVLLEFREYWKEESYTMENPSEFLFRRENGYVMFPDTVNTVLEKFIKRNNLTKISPHELRHTFITVMVADYLIPLPIVGNFVGHNDIATTLINYTHINNDAKMLISNKLNQLPL